MFYTGQTNNLSRRLKEHNAGTGGWTSHHFPVSLVHSFETANRQHARYYEKRIKAMGARNFLRDIALQQKNASILCGVL
jgi:predicted GIY-YIG superfamily endonuclease